MPDFKRNVEKAVGSFKYEGETWRDVFKRVGSEGGLDLKTVANVVICILEELDDRKETREDPIGRTPARTEKGTIQDGAREAKKEVPAGTSDTAST